MEKKAILMTITIIMFVAVVLIVYLLLELKGAILRKRRNPKHSRTDKED